MASTVPGGWRPHMVSTGKTKLWICSGPVSQDEHPSQLLRGRVAALGRDASTQCLRVTFQFRPGPDSSAMPARSSIVVTATQPRSPSSLMWRSNTWGMTPRRFHPPSSTHISAGSASLLPVPNLCPRITTGSRVAYTTRAFPALEQRAYLLRAVSQR